MNNQPLLSSHFNDASGAPAGGTTYAPGLCIGWQNGPLAVDGTRKDPNGCFVETVIRAAIDRLEYYQSSRFASDYNDRAIVHLNAALAECAARTADREKRGVEGTHKQ